MRLPVVLCLLLAAAPLRAQEAATAADTAAVLAPVHRLFDAMRAGDAEAARAAFHPEATLAAFHPEATLAGAETRDGAPQLRVLPVERFIEAIGRPHEKPWDERVWDVVVHVDGELATAWMRYAFYLGDTLDHCGVDAFELFRGADGWVVTRIADTSRREGCTPPPAGR